MLVGSPPSRVEHILEVAPEFWNEHASEARKAALRGRTAALRDERSDAHGTPQRFVERYLAEAPKYWHDPTYDAGHLWRGVPIDLRAMTAFRRFFAGDYELWWDPDQLPAPVLAVMGRHDFAVPHVLWSDAERKRRNLTFRLFEHSGHTPQLEEPARFDRELLDWIDAERDDG